MAAAEEEAQAGFQIYGLEDSARIKGMWAGALERTPIPDLCGVYPTSVEKNSDPPGPAFEIRGIRRDHTPALLKIVDEALVNASDHTKEHENQPKAADRVARISLDFARETGRLVVENDGPGIPVVVHEEASAKAGHKVYVPEVAFAVFLAGKNMEKPPDSVKGGINGIGAKLINVHSAHFEVETVAGRQVYRQSFRNRMRTRGVPEVFSTGTAKALKELPDRRRAPHTRISFVPAYAELGYELGLGGELAVQDADDLEAWCRWRMFLLAAYVGPKVSVVFNGDRCPTTSAETLAALAVAHDPNAIIISCAAKASKPPCNAHPWDLAIAVVPSSNRFGHLSVINGVHCAKGTHVTYFKKLLSEAISAKLVRATKAKNKKPSVAETCKQLYLVAVGPLPGADWGGQRKDELQVAEAKLRPYTIASPVLNNIAGKAVDSLLRAVEKGVGRGRKRRVEAEKYTRARCAGTKDSAKCALLAAEGDSAITLLRAGLTLGPETNRGGPSFEHFGIISLGGVIMNAMKKITEVETAEGEFVTVRSEQLRNNKVLKALVEVLGLDFTCRYQSSTERARLRYGAVVVATDQDLDGTGKILPLVLVWFYVFWPNLIAHGYIKRFMTPVIRVYSKTRPPHACMHEFFYENEFNHWVAKQGGEDRVKAGYTVKYYKGLATHDETEVVEMFRQFSARVYTFTLDDAAAKLFDIYFGPRPDLRKTALATPVAYLSYEEAQKVHRTRLIPCSVQLQVDAKAYKLDDIQRKIPGIADGLSISRRKVLAGAFRRFASANREIKVFQLGGYVAEHMFYHHGDASLNSTIVGMAQRFPGALLYPYLVGIGQYGSRHFGGNDAGSPRYINVRLAAPFAKAMFPPEDTCMLPHVFEDGERAQPKYFLGVLPTALLESFEIPSEGWRHKSYARELDDILRLVRAYVSGDSLVARVAAAAEAAAPGTSVGKLDLHQADLLALNKQFPLAVSLRGYGEHLGESERKELVRFYKGAPHAFGWYWPEHLGEKTTVLHVTELPIRKTTQSFLKDLDKPVRAKYIDEVDDYSSDTKIDVRIRLAPGAWDEICANYGDADIDPFEDFLLLRTSLKPFLNYYSENEGVLEFGDDYHAVFFHWASLRRDLYRQRLEREATILSLKIRLETEIVRYIGTKIDFAKMADEGAASEALSFQNFAKFDSGLLYAPRFTPTASIVSHVTQGANTSHAHILNLREKDQVVEAKNARETKIAAMSRRLAKVEECLAEQPFAGASIWNAEIEQVMHAAACGEKTRWRF
ncbi:DNA topoisomerase 2 [Elysia marginata]|uniref:DNA topoisomerase (ATP-hydrolyzing) n=1 Tax=Elysia marginata TaxID=1093978 RepID=A0AAV4GXB0_9GAST|nr:DNA topoisomerase 2 [Elysia marginata]